LSIANIDYLGALEFGANDRSAGLFDRQSKSGCIWHILEHWHMLDHVSITVANIGAAEKFYDAIMSALGVPKVRKSEVRLGYGERCDGDHPDRNYLSSRLEVSQMMLLRGTGVSKRLTGRQWMHFGKQA
jgi:hypothetical protein